MGSGYQPSDYNCCAVLLPRLLTRPLLHLMCFMPSVEEPTKSGLNGFPPAVSMSTLTRAGEPGPCSSGSRSQRRFHGCHSIKATSESSGKFSPLRRAHVDYSSLESLAPALAGQEVVADNLGVVPRIAAVKAHKIGIEMNPSDSVPPDGSFSSFRRPS